MTQDKGFLTRIRVFVQSSKQGLGGFNCESYLPHDLWLLAEQQVKRSHCEWWKSFVQSSVVKNVKKRLQKVCFKWAFPCTTLEHNPVLVACPATRRPMHEDFTQKISKLWQPESARTAAAAPMIYKMRQHKNRSSDLSLFIGGSRSGSVLSRGRQVADSGCHRGATNYAKFSVYSQHAAAVCGDITVSKECRGWAQFFLLYYRQRWQQQRKSEKLYRVIYCLESCLVKRGSAYLCDDVTPTVT